MKRIISAVALIAAVTVLLCACGKQAEPLSNIFSTIKTDYNVTDMVEFTDAADLERFYGIAAEDVAEFAGGINSSGVDQEEIVMIKASSSDAVERVQTSLMNRLDSKRNETKNYNPEQYAIVEKCSVDTDNDYVSMFISADADAMKLDYQKAIGVI